MRLIEPVVATCHQIGAYLFELGDGAHKHELHNAWLAKVLQEEESGKTCRAYFPPPAAFFHRFYHFHKQYPRGVADVVGYWAEGRIFGGVVAFDRGESEQEVSWHPPFSAHPFLFPSFLLPCAPPSVVHHVLVYRSLFSNPCIFLPTV